MAILKDAKRYWDSDECADISHEYFTKVAPVLREDLLNLGVPVDGVKVLDLGCGTGRIAQMYKPKKYVGVDQSEKMLAKAHETLDDRPEVKLHHKSLYSFKTDEHFDTLLLIDVLPHLDEKGCISTFKQVLRKFDADVYVMRLFVSLKGETIYYNSSIYGHLSISYTPEQIEEKLLPLAEQYGKEAFLMIASNTSPSVANGYIVAYNNPVEVEE